MLLLWFIHNWKYDFGHFPGDAVCCNYRLVVFTVQIFSVQEIYNLQIYKTLEVVQKGSFKI